MVGTPPLTPRTLHQRLQSEGAGGRFCIAYSGGLDSTVLLHLMSTLAAEGVLRLRAVHVHHGLQPAADDWASHCVRVAGELGVACQVLPVAVDRTSGEGLEAAARRARYAALRGVLEAGEVLLTAHHADDQAETVLLHLLRGSGPRGLAAMRGRRALGEHLLLRPLLPWGRKSLCRYASEHRLSWVDDPTNEHTGHDRNWLRHTLWPVLTARWPDASDRLARAAHEQAEADGLLQDLAALDLARQPAGTGLHVPALAALSGARARNLVRHWLLRSGVRPPPRARLEQGLMDLLRAGPDRQPVLSWPEGELRRYRDRIFRLPPGGPAPWPVPEQPWDLREPLVIPGIGELRLVPAEAGIPASLVAAAGLSVGPRRPGERACLDTSPGRRPLSRYFQEAGVPPWQRDRIPVLRQSGDIVAVANIGTERRYRRVPGYRLEWRDTGAD